MMLQKKGLHKNNPSIAVVATLFGDKDDIKWLEANDFTDLTETDLSGTKNIENYDSAQRRAIALGPNQKGPVLIVQGPPGIGKTGLIGCVCVCNLLSPVTTWSRLPTHSITRVNEYKQLGGLRLSSGGFQTTWP
ncbi:hypothetical protein LXL04_021615 [Taraxacum kok-saghyz]